MIDSSRQQIYRLEHGRCDLSDFWIKRLAAALDCEPWELMDPECARLLQEGSAVEQGMPNRIRELRLKNSLTQEGLAKEIGSCHQQVYKLETGRAELTHKWLRRLSRALGCEPWELLDRAGGGLTPDEQDLLRIYRSLVPGQRNAVHAYFVAGHKNNILARYSALTKADREIVDWFLFGQSL